MEIQTKDELLEQMSLAVEQIQKQFVPGSDVIKDCQETYFLCSCIDQILHHGLKEGLISWATEPSIWPLLEKITCTKDLEEINMLRLKTDKEKCGAWIRMAVNVNLLGSYISTINEDKSLLSHHYYEYAFLRDPVLTDTVKSLLNYGIANFDFHISVDQRRVPKLANNATEFDSFPGRKLCDQNKVNGDEQSHIEYNAAKRDSFKKKKRKKKQPIQTVVINDLDDRGEPKEETNSERLINGIIKNNLQEDNKLNFGEKEDGFDTTDGGAQPLKQLDRDEVHRSVSENAMTRGDESFSGDHVLDFDKSLVESDTRMNGYVAEVFAGRTSDDPVKAGTTGTTEVGGEPEGQRGTVSASSETEEHVHDKQIASDQPKHDVMLTNRDHLSGSVDLNSDLTRKDISTSVNAVPKHEFSTSDFHLEDQDVSENVTGTDITSTVTRDKEGDLSRDMSVTLSGETKETSTNDKAERRTSISQDSTSLEKSEKQDSGVVFRSEKYSSSREDIGRNESEDFTQVTTTKPLNYRVKKVENPEFVSSSYGSSLSDVTDMSYDDRDFNFIPGIHKLSSSHKSGSSYSRKNTADSSVSFDENGVPVFDTSHYTDSSSRHSSIDGVSGRFAEASTEWDMFEDLLNMEEEHFSGPESFGGLSTSEELEIAIEHYKKMIKLKQKSTEREELIQKLIKLRLRLQKEKDGPVEVNSKFRKILSHHFHKQEEPPGSKFYCDQCGKNIWTMWQPMFTCNDCGYHSHKKCLERIQRPCPNRNISSASYILDICPDTGLDAQQYRCAECRRAIAFSKDGVSEARICDYTGQYFCEHCHWNDHAPIPARVARNWDFTAYKVCRKTKQLLDLIKTRPLLNLQEINPMLFRYVEELREIAKLREDILIMKKYFLTCREALESKLLIQLQKRQHFVDNSDIYSFQDLLDLNNDVLLPEISKIHALFLAHIKADCELCRARGFICEVCQDSKDIIFAFDPHTVKCRNCSSVFHKMCFKPEDCPKCHRRRKVAENT